MQLACGWWVSEEQSSTASSAQAPQHLGLGILHVCCHMLDAAEPTDGATDRIAHKGVRPDAPADSSTSSAPASSAC